MSQTERCQVVRRVACFWLHAFLVDGGEIDLENVLTCCNEFFAQAELDELEKLIPRAEALLEAVGWKESAAITVIEILLDPKREGDPMGAVAALTRNLHYDSRVSKRLFNTVLEPV